MGLSRSLLSMAVLSGARLSGEAAKTRAKRARTSGKPRETLLLPQSPRGLSALARLYYLARPTKTAVLRRLAVTKISRAVLGQFCVELIT